MLQPYRGLTPLRLERGKIDDYGIDCWLAMM